MERYDTRTDRVVAESKKIDEFLEEIKNVSKKHGLSLSHQDAHGAFLIEDYDERYTSWLAEAHIGTTCTKI
jgi:hypothetical protein